MCGFGEWFSGDWCNWGKKNQKCLSALSFRGAWIIAAMWLIAKIWSFIPLSTLNNNHQVSHCNPHPFFSARLIRKHFFGIVWIFFCFVQTSCENSYAWLWLNLNRNQGHRSTATMLWVSKYLMWVCSWKSCTVYTELAHYCKGKITSFLISLITTLPISLPWWLQLRMNKKEPGRRLTHMRGES